jgi:hypothetical protein
MVISKKSKIIIIVTILFIIVVLGMILGMTLWNNAVSVGRNNQVSSHSFTLQEARIARYFLPFSLLLPDKIDGDVTFVYGSTITGQGIDRDRLTEIRKILATNTIDYTKMSEADFRNLRYCEVNVEGGNYDIRLICFRGNLQYTLENYSDVINKKNQNELIINKTYFCGLDRGYCIDIFPGNYQEKLGDRSWGKLTKEEKIELYGREWFDSVELSDIDEFMKEVCAYNGINSDWLDNKPVYNIK